MLEARTLTVGFSDSEDRLWLRLGTDHDGAVQLWLTRRVLQQLLAQVWDLLGRTLQMPPNFMGQDEPSPPAQRDKAALNTMMQTSIIQKRASKVVRGIGLKAMRRAMGRTTQSINWPDKGSFGLNTNSRWKPVHRLMMTWHESSILQR